MQGPLQATAGQGAAGVGERRDVAVGMVVDHVLVRAGGSVRFASLLGGMPFCLKRLDQARRGPAWSSGRSGKIRSAYLNYDLRCVQTRERAELSRSCAGIVYHSPRLLQFSLLSSEA